MCSYSQRLRGRALLTFNGREYPHTDSPVAVIVLNLAVSDDVGQRKDHLDVRVLFGGDPAELLHGSLLFDLGIVFS